MRPKPGLVALLLGSILGLGITVPASSSPRPAQNHQKIEKQSEKAHQKAEKSNLKEHQRQERAVNGNTAVIREHEKNERAQLKQHQKNEKNNLKAHQKSGR